MFKKHVVILAMVAVVFAGADILWAKAGSSGGSRSSGGSSSSRSSYGNSSSASKSSTATAPASKYGNSATNPSSGTQQQSSDSKKKYGNTAGAASAGGQTGKPSAYDQKLNTTVSKQQAKESLSKYEEQQGRFKSKDTTTNYGGYTGNPIVNRTRGYDQNTYAYRRDNFYSGNSYQPPQYVYMSAPSFGMWDAMFLWFMLDHASDRNYSRMYYNHQNDPDFQRWRQETEKLSGENAELKAKLANLDKQVAELKGEPVDQSYIPPGVDADIALNKKVIEAAHPVKKESHYLRWFLIFVLLALLIYYIYNKRKGAASAAKYRLD
ncbi:hypothetical protein [Candidatus Magnetominusculus dajiuhuensis]|uniref:hypothetical protein n=1 Tax=Candidatus Magnetominusculus dajiuhuensis TaxID=3137712 RepID=UPI003B42D673